MERHQPEVLKLLCIVYPAPDDRMSIKREVGLQKKGLQRLKPMQKTAPTRFVDSPSEVKCLSYYLVISVIPDLNLVESGPCYDVIPLVAGDERGCVHGAAVADDWGMIHI